MSSLHTTRHGHLRLRTASFHRLLRVDGGMPSFLAASDCGMLRYSVMSTKFWPLGTVTGLMIRLFSGDCVDTSALDCWPGGEPCGPGCCCCGGGACCWACGCCCGGCC